MLGEYNLLNFEGRKNLRIAYASIHSNSQERIQPVGVENHINYGSGVSEAGCGFTRRESTPTFLFYNSKRILTPLTEGPKGESYAIQQAAEVRAAGV